MPESRQVLARSRRHSYVEKKKIRFVEEKNYNSDPVFQSRDGQSRWIVGFSVGVHRRFRAEIVETETGKMGEIAAHGGIQERRARFPR